MQDGENEHIYHHEYFLLHKKKHKEMHELNFTIPIFEPLPPQYFVRCGKRGGALLLLGHIRGRAVVVYSKTSPPVPFLHSLCPSLRVCTYVCLYILYNIICL